MKLAEALLERKSLKDKIDSLRARLDENVLIQEGDQPNEQPQVLLEELGEALRQLEQLIRKINGTNNIARLADGSTVSEAIVRRDVLRMKREAIEQVVNSASLRHHRFGRNEVKFVLTVNTADLRQQIDALSKQWRELDSEIQAANWTMELVT
ncbi:MAG TPA: DIP1984 family protein [Planctomicrobium sp.]|nr:DIP1984 family protein [Planctomicrobium sp.]